MRNLNDGDYIETIVIGGGQTGLTVGYELRKKGRDFVILDANHRVGDAWRNRWDSLLVFTPARYLGLPGMRFPGRGDAFVGKDAVAEYLESYAEANDLDVHLGVRVTKVSHDGARYSVETNGPTFSPTTWSSPWPIIRSPRFRPSRLTSAPT